MPRLVRTLEQILREERKDVYFVQFSDTEQLSLADGADSSGSSGIDARKTLKAWLKENLPDTRTEILCPDGSFGVDPETADIRIDFDAAGLAKFCAEWEEPDGTSRNPHFQCFIRSFDDWRSGIAACLPTFERPEGILAGWFWDTPRGLLHHAAPAIDDSYKDSLVFDFVKPDNVWFMAGELVPEWRDVKTEDFVGGRIHYDLEKRQWHVEIGFISVKHFDHYERNELYRNDPENQRRICEWFGLLPERVVFEELSDY